MRWIARSVSGGATSAHNQQQWRQQWRLSHRWIRIIIICALAGMTITAPFISIQPGHVRAASAPSASTDMLTPGSVVHETSCEQAPPQSVKDRATYTPAELARYGLPSRAPHEPFAKWAKIVRAATYRVCSYTVATLGAKGVQGTSHDAHAPLLPSQPSGWGGNVANQGGGGQRYTEADMDFFVPCISGTPAGYDPGTTSSAAFASWIGIGGQIPPLVGLVQAGVYGEQTYNFSRGGWNTLYEIFTESPDSPGTLSLTRTYFAVNCGAHLYAKVWDSGSTGCMFVMQIDNGVNTGTQCYGVTSDEHTAEAIVEFPSAIITAYGTDFIAYFAKYGQQTFYGVGMTDNGGYYGMGQAPHQVDVAHHICNPDCSEPLTNTEPIGNDPGDPPYDQYTVAWLHYQ